MRKRLYALVDCSAFYCSCERAFRADLRGKPICVLSNNDGCVIALTPEVKALGIRMGTPYYQVKDMLHEKGVATFSSNYCLYGDMSKRVIGLLERFSPDVEQYSIDEAFVCLNVDTERVEEERERITAIAEEIHLTVLRGTGIPVRVSFAETKTLAKVGSEYTKKLMKEGKKPCVCFWEHPEKESFMKELHVSDVWGIGRAWTAKLEGTLIRSAYQLSRTDPREMKMRYNIVMERLVRELQGTSCIPLSMFADPRKSLVRSRMFSQKIKDPRYIYQAISSHLFRASEKLRREHLITGHLTIMMTTGKYGDGPRRYGTASVRVPIPTNDTLILSEVAHELFKQCYLRRDRYGNDYLYSKAGIMFTEIMSEDMRQKTLFTPTRLENPKLMRAIDSLNKRFGKNSIVLASMGTPDKLRRVDMGARGAVEWGMRRHQMSPRYTTVWEDLLRVRI